jgi:hypothetical protein
LLAHFVGDKRHSLGIIGEEICGLEEEAKPAGVDALNLVFSIREQVCIFRYGSTVFWRIPCIRAAIG